MNIGFDIDGVLNNSRKWEIEAGTKYFARRGIPLIDENAYHLCNMFGVTSKDEDEFWDKLVFDYAKEVVVRDFASEIVNKLKADGNKIFIITARYLSTLNDERGEKMRQLVKDWLKTNNIEYDDIVFSGESKINNIKNKKIDIMIEDSPRNIKEISKLIPVICYDNVYNKDVYGKNIFRVNDFKELYNKIYEIKNAKI